MPMHRATCAFDVARARMQSFEMRWKQANEGDVGAPAASTSGDLLGGALSRVSNVQDRASAYATAFARGDDVELHQVSDEGAALVATPPRAQVSRPLADTPDVVQEQYTSTGVVPMSRRTYTFVALMAAGLTAGSLSAQELATIGVVAPPRVAASGIGAGAAAAEVAPPAVAPVGRRAQLARMYELRRGNRALASEVAETAQIESDLTLELDRLKAEASEGEREITAIDSATEATRAERYRLEARLRELDSIAVYEDDSERAAPHRVALPPLAPGSAADSAASVLAPPAAPVDVRSGREADANGPRPLAIAPRSHSNLRQWLFYGGVTAGVVAVRAFQLDSDPGGYHDGLKTESAFPDKAVHLLAAWAITSLGSDLKVGAWKSAAVVCASGVGFELAQGYVSRYDIGANCLGAAGAAAWRSWVSR